MIASSEQRLLAQRDLENLSIPPGLSETQFRTGVASCLLLSSFFLDVVSAQPDTEDNKTSLYRLAHAWSIAPRTAARRKGTALAWQRYFFP